MKYNTSIRKLSEIKADALCLFLSGKNDFSPSAKELDKSLGNFLSNAVKKFGFSSETGATLTLTPSDGNQKNIILVGLGPTKNQDSNSQNKALDAATTALLACKPKSICVDVASLTSDQKSITATAASRVLNRIADKTYRFDTYKSEKNKTPLPSSITLACTKEQQTQVKKASAYAEAQVQGMKLTRDLGNEPGNVCTPTYLANMAKQLAKEYPNISCKVLEEKDMEKLNMGAFLSVSKGSTEPGKLIVMEYKGANDKSAPHVLVGKGITFDTGGISLKPGELMDEMKYDMCGAASVFGTMKAVAELAPKKNITGIIAAAENMPAGNASKPGDIVTTSSGQTVEILNTDAEGRLVLCDALTYAERFKPKTVIDIATLTGACIIALGHATSAVMSNSDDFAQTLMQSGQEAEDKAWQLPIWDEYQKQLDSPFADMQNIGGRPAGSITAACFLARFAKKFTWAHLDIAGTAWKSGANKGATGRPVPLLLNYLINHAK